MAFVNNGLNFPNLASKSAPTLSDIALLSDAAASSALKQATFGQALGIGTKNSVDGRLTLTSGTPVTTAGVSAAGTLYFTPYKGNTIALYTSSAWRLYTFAELSIAVPAVANQVYDVFIYDNASTLTIELVAWTNDTTRATALATQDGIYCKTGALDRRYVGTVRTVTASQLNDTQALRHVWNYYNRVEKNMLVIETTDSWVYSSNTLRQARATATNQLDYVMGVQEDAVRAAVYAFAGDSSGGVGMFVGIGIDSTTTNSAQINNPGSTNAAAGLVNSNSQYLGYPGIGRHTLVWLEATGGVGTGTWYGDFGIPANFQSGITGSLFC